MKIKLLLPILLFVSFPLVAQNESLLELTDIFDMEFVSDPQISPDGNKIIYVRNFKDIMTDKNLSNLWIINYDGSQNRPLTTGNQNDFYPRWSHDGKKIIFKSNKADNRMKLYMMWLDTKETAPLTNTPKAPGAVSWSHDDRYLAFTMFVSEAEESIVKLPTKPEGAKWNTPPTYIDKLNYRGDGQGYIKGGHDQLFTLSIDGGTPKQLTTSKFDHGAPVWAKNDRTLYFSANFNPDEAFEPANSEVYALNILTAEVSPLTTRYGPDASPVVSPDGKMIAYMGNDDKLQGYQITELYVMNSDGTNSKLLSESFDRDIANAQWANDGKGLYFQYDTEGATKIGHISLDGKVTTLVDGLGGLSLGRPYNAGDFTVSKNSRFAYTLGNTQHPSDLGVADKKSYKRLTFVNDDLFSFRDLGKTEEIWWKSSYDQKDIQGWVVTPPNFDPSKKYPFILEIHGGPFTSYGSVNHDYEDLMSGVDAVIEKGFIDTDNLFVTGGSGGGVLTAWIVGKTDRFKAAVVAKPVINWTSFVLYADGAAFFSKYWFGKKPWEDPENYFRRSPLMYVANVTTPTMLLTGEEDYRTPIAESEQFYTALKLEGVETAMVRIPGAGHGIANRPSNLVAKIASVLAWFDKYKTKK